MTDDATCLWARDGDDEYDVWATKCGHYFSINDGTPTENSFRFCVFCGKPLQECPPEIAEEDE